jgi:hypothetical protein
MDTEGSAQAHAPTETGLGDTVARYESEIFHYVPHPHIARRRRQGPVKVKDQLDRGNAVSRFNARFALLITVAVGSMWCAYIFALLAFVSLPSVLKQGDLIIIVGWVAQTFIQLVLLPVIIVGQNLQAAASDKRSQQTYDDAEAVLHEALQIQQHLSAQDTRLEEIIAALRKAYPAASGDNTTAPTSPGA